MKTLADIRNLIPIIIEQIKKADHEIGTSYVEQDEDGWSTCHEYAANYYFYEEDGWLISIEYQCAGEWDNDHGDCGTPPSSSLIEAWGEVVEICASHFDEESGQETKFDKPALEELWTAVDKALRSIA